MLNSRCCELGIIQILIWLLLVSVLVLHMLVICMSVLIDKGQ